MAAWTQVGLDGLGGIWFHPLVDSILSPPHHTLNGKIKYTQEKEEKNLACRNPLPNTLLQGFLFSRNESFVKQQQQQQQDRAAWWQQT